MHGKSDTHSSPTLSTLN